jgi:4-oxalocrotonate tautomerase
MTNEVRESKMPLSRIFLRRGKSAVYRKAILDGIYAAMRDVFDVPENDRFMIVSEHDADDFDISPDYLGIMRSEDAIVVQLTVSNTRGIEQKKALYRRIVENLAKNPGLRPQDVMINLVEVSKENWSFGNGEAQYA